MATDALHDLLSDKIATAVQLLNNAEFATATDTPDWAEILDLVAKAAQTVESATETAVRGARHDGRTWDDVGRGLGVSRQGAQQRFGG